MGIADSTIMKFPRKIGQVRRTRERKAGSPRSIVSVNRSPGRRGKRRSHSISIYVIFNFDQINSLSACGRPQRWLAQGGHSGPGADLAAGPEDHNDSHPKPADLRQPADFGRVAQEGTLPWAQSHRPPHETRRSMRPPKGALSRPDHR